MTFGEIRFRVSKMAPGLDPDLVDGWINDRYQTILDRRRWKGLEKDGSFVTVAAYSTGSLTLTNGSAAVTGVGTTFTAAMTARKLRVIGRSESYTFTQLGATTGTLDRLYEGDTSANLGYEIYQDTVDLAADFKEPLVDRNERRPLEIVHWTRQDLDRAAPARVISGEPQIYVFAPDKADGTRRAQLYPIPAFAASYPYSYIRKATRFLDDDSALAIFDWVSVECLLSFVQASVRGHMKDYTGATLAEQKGDAELMKMILRDERIDGPKKLRMAQKYTRHRLERTLRSQGRDRRQLP